MSALARRRPDVGDGLMAGRAFGESAIGAIAGAPVTVAGLSPENRTRDREGTGYRDVTWLGAENLP